MALRKRLLLATVSLVVALFVGEAGLQLFYRVANTSWLWQYNNFHVTYISAVADRRQYALRAGFADAQIGISINRKGFRSPVSMADPSGDTPVIVFLGDSKAFGVGARDEETYAYRIEQDLRNDGSHLQTVNAGVPSYNMRQALDRFDTDVLPNYRPTLVVLQGTFNDISLLTYYRENWNPDRPWADLRYGGFVPPLPMLRKAAILYYAGQAMTHTSPAAPHGAVEYETYPDADMLRIVRRELEGFVAACRDKSISVVLLPIDPFYYQTSHFEQNPSLPLWESHTQFIDKWKDMLLRYDDLLLDVSAHNDSVFFFDVRQHLDATDRRTAYADFLHYSAEGNRQVAEGLFAYLQAQGLLKPRMDRAP